MLRKSCKVKNEIIKPKSQESNDETYCILSLRIVQYVQALLFFVSCLMLFKGFTFAIGTKFGDWFYSQQFRECCERKPEMYRGFILQIELIFENLRYLTNILVIFLQITEWYSIIHLIKSQQDRSEREIFMDHTTENQSVNTVYSAAQIKYRRNELFLSKCFIVI